MTVDEGFNVTRLLRAWRTGDAQANEALMSAVYEELRRQAAAYLRRHPPHLSLRNADVRNDVAPVDDERRVVSLAQRGVERGTMLGLIHLFAGEERCDPSRKSRFDGVVDQQ